MSMYKITRQEAADKLNISTRSVDRYIKAWKLRAKKDWKVVYVKNADIENLINWWSSKQEVIVEKKSKDFWKEKDSIVRKDENVAGTLWWIYKDLKEEINKKDTIIQTLAIRVWKAEELANNSISLLDFKKSQYLLEESKVNLNDEINNLKRDKEMLEWEIKYEKKSNIILIVFLIILLVIAWLIWFIQI